MKLLAVLLLFVIPLQWETDFEQAKTRAKNENKLLFLNFSGSDWCGPCIMLRKEYLESDEFSFMANEHLILVNADFPRKKKNQFPPEQTAKNEALAAKYNKDGLFPYSLLLDANGKVLKTWKGSPDVNAADWSREISSICRSSKQKS